MALRRTIALTAFALGAAGLAMAQTQEQFATRLDTVPIDTRTQADVTGNGVVHAELAGNELTVEGSFSGLAGAATQAWLHVGTAVGARGPAAHELEVVHGPNGTVSGTVRLSRRELEALGAGRLYIQIHSEAAPEGNLWGWLLPQE